MNTSCLASVFSLTVTAPSFHVSSSARGDTRVSSRVSLLRPRPSSYDDDASINLMLGDKFILEISSVSSSIFDLFTSDLTLGDTFGLADFFFFGLLSDVSDFFRRLSGLKAVTIFSFNFVGFLLSSKDLASKLPEQLSLSNPTPESIILLGSGFCLRERVGDVNFLNFSLKLILLDLVGDSSGSVS